MSTKPLRAWLPGRIDPFDVGTAAVIVQLNNFASSIRHETFRQVISTNLSRGATTGTTLELVARMADALRESPSGSDWDVLGKSIQETLFFIGGFDWNQRSFGRNVQTFVRESGCKGLIQLFLQMHLSNLIWKQLRNSSRMPRDLKALERLPNGIDHLCRQAVKTTTASWKKWPQLDRSSARRVLQTLRSETMDMLAEPSISLPKAA
jgi:hypothetical protein